MPSNYKTVVNFRDGIQVDTDDLISNNGLVGIGSTIPRQQLDVRGNVIIDENTELNNLKVVGYTTYYGNVNVATGTSVGIGTTVPEAAFQVGIGTTGFTVDEHGNVTAVQYFGSGANLTDIPASVWVNPGAGNSIYSVKDVGVGTDLVRDGADFGVGYEIYMDAKSGVSTFEGVVTKNITVLNATGAGQGNVTAEVGTFSTVTASTSVSAPSFIGTITNAVRTQVAYGLTDSPDIDVNYITGVGGTFTGITSFTTFQGSGGIVASAGIITANTFSGTATTASHAAIAYGIGGDPDIQVDKVTVNGLAPSIIKGSGVSTIGQDLSVGSFLGVGGSTSSVGDAAGFIGTVRVHDGDLLLGGSISIGGSLVGTVDLGGTQNINVLNVGAGLSVAGVTTMTGVITGGGDFNITGKVVAKKFQSTEGVILGGGITATGPIETQGALTLGAGGGISIGSGITMNGPIVGASSITATGAIDGGDIIGDDIRGTNLNIAGISTLGTANCTNLTVAGNLQTIGIGTISTGDIEINGLSGIISASSFISQSGVSTFNDIFVTGGNSTKIFGKYIGVNTDAPGITDGAEFYSQGEVYLDHTSNGIGIGSTSGQRPASAQLYVGLARSENGDLVGTQSIFEGSVGIGTTNCALNSQFEDSIEIYKNIYLLNNHLGVGGTLGIGGTTGLRIGINTTKPGGTIDMRYAGEPFILPRNYVPNDGNMSGNEPAIVNVNDNDYAGSMWYDHHNHRIWARFSDSEPTGIATDLGYDFFQERGWKGRVIDQTIGGSFEAYREAAQSAGGERPENPPELPPGWGTSNQCYYQPTDQLQIKGSDTIWRSLVGSAYTGVSIDIDTLSTPKKVSFIVAGIGSTSLNLY